MIRFLKNNNFIERSIMGALSFFKNSIFTHDIAEKKGFLQSLDSRVKAPTVCNGGEHHERTVADVVKWQDIYSIFG